MKRPNLSYGLLLEDYQSIEPDLTRNITDAPLGAHSSQRRRDAAQSRLVQSMPRRTASERKADSRRRRQENTAA